MEFPEKSRYKPETAQALLDLFRRSPELQEPPSWLKTLRYGALTALEQEGLPTPLLERWKYTNLAPHIKGFGQKLDAAPLVYNGPDKFVKNLREILSDPPDWLASLLSERDEGAFRYRDMMLWDMGNLFLRDGLVVDIPVDNSVDKPVEITVSGSDSGFYAPRLVIRLGRGSDLTVIERLTGEGRFWNNCVTQIQVGENARLRHYRIQDSGDTSVFTGNTHVQVERDGTYEAFTLTAGAALSRNQIHAELRGSNAVCNFYGINLLSGGQHGDTTAEIEHEAPHCRSNQFIRSVMSGRAHGVFQGKVHVHRAGQKTDAYQLSNALLLSEGAEMDTKPELEIYADDVKCSHGATTGRLEDEPLFYLRSRGLSEAEARSLLIGAFVGEVVDKLEDEVVKILVQKRIQTWLDKNPPSFLREGGHRGEGSHAP